MTNSTLLSDIRQSLRNLTTGRYEVQSELGRGGMATVYLGEDTRQNRPVAVKILHRHLLDDDEHCARFRREAESISRLDHPGLVEVYAFLEEPGEFLAIVMEYVDGPSLEQLIEDSPPIVPELAAEVLIPVLHALGRAHRKGIVHRDLKPANVLIGLEARPRLTDFGIAHVADRQTLTDTGAMIGSPAYMSPEGVTGQPIDHRTDLFSIGSILYQMVTGQPPYEGDAPSIVMRNIARCRRRRADFVREDVGRRFADILEQFLHIAPDERPDSADNAAKLLEAFVIESLGDDRPDLRAWVDAPTDYPSQLRRRVASELFDRAEAAAQARRRRRALALVERLLAMDVDRTRANAVLDLLHGEPSDSPDNRR